MLIVKRKLFGYVFSIQGMNPTLGNYTKERYSPRIQEKFETYIVGGWAIKLRKDHSKGYLISSVAF